MLGGDRVPDGAAVATANGTYLKTESGGALLPSTITRELSNGSSGREIIGNISRGKNAYLDNK